MGAKELFSHCTLTCLKLEYGTVWTELTFETHTLTHSAHSYKTGGGCEKHVLTLQRHVFKKYDVELCILNLLF